MRELNFRSLAKITVILIFFTLLVYILVVGKSILVPLTISFFIAFLLIPFNHLLERIKFPRALAAITSIVVAILVLSGVLTLMGSQVKRFTDDMDQITEKLAGLKSKLPEWAASSVQGYSVEKFFNMAQDHMGTIFNSLSSFFGSFTVIFIVPIYIALILIYRDHLKEFIYRLFRKRTDGVKTDSSKNPDGVKALIRKIRKVIQKYITGVFYVMCILFVLYSVALLSLGIEHAFLFAAIAAALNIIPFIGPFLGSALPILFAFLTKDSLFYPLAVLGSFILVQAIEGNFLTPKIVGNNVSLNALVTLISLIVGASIWGFVGMILFIPIMAIVREICQAVDGLEPYAYLLGNPDDGPKRANIFTLLYRKVKAKVTSDSD